MSHFKYTTLDVSDVFPKDRKINVLPMVGSKGQAFAVTFEDNDGNINLRAFGENSSGCVLSERPHVYPGRKIAAFGTFLPGKDSDGQRELLYIPVYQNPDKDIMVHQDAYETPDYKSFVLFEKDQLGDSEPLLVACFSGLDNNKSVLMLFQSPDKNNLYIALLSFEMVDETNGFYTLSRTEDERFPINFWSDNVDFEVTVTNILPQRIVEAFNKEPKSHFIRINDGTEVTIFLRPSNAWSLHDSNAQGPMVTKDSEVIVPVEAKFSRFWNDKEKADYHQWKSPDFEFTYSFIENKKDIPEGSNPKEIQATLTWCSPYRFAPK